MKRLFGTDGVRSLAGAYPLDDETVGRIGGALVRCLPRERRPPRVLVGRDTQRPWFVDRTGRWIGWLRRPVGP